VKNATVIIENVVFLFILVYPVKSIGIGTISTKRLLILLSLILSGGQDSYFGVY
jgi:hypothetical protein